MHRPNMLNQNVLKKPFVVLGSGVAALALTGCLTDYADTNAQARERARGAAERYAYDYTAGVSTYDEDNHDFTEDCLVRSPYRLSSAVVTFEGDDGVVVTPTAGKFEPLHFEGLHNTDEPLQPADDYTELILVSYGCHTDPNGSLEPYGDVYPQ